MCQAPPSKKRCLEEPMVELQWFSEAPLDGGRVKDCRLSSVLPSQDMGQLHFWASFTMTILYFELLAQFLNQRLSSEICACQQLVQDRLWQSQSDVASKQLCCCCASRTMWGQLHTYQLLLLGIVQCWQPVKSRFSFVYKLLPPVCGRDAEKKLQWATQSSRDFACSC